MKKKKKCNIFFCIATKIVDNNKQIDINITKILNKYDIFTKKLKAS